MNCLNRKPGVVPTALLLITFLTLPVAGFQTGNLNFFVTNELLFNINTTHEKSEQFYETLSVFANLNKWSFNLTLRANNFYKRDPNTTLEDTNFGIFRKTLRYSSGKFSAVLGDLYAVLGHGLVLSVQKNDEIFLERTILGADLHYFLKSADIRLLGGEIRDDTFDQKWRMAGGEVEIKLPGNHRLGGRFTYISDVDTLRSLGDRITWSLSLKSGKQMKNLSFYAEYAALNFTAQGSNTGKAFYSNITYNRNRTTIMVEYKNYHHFDNELNNPPMADREDETATLNDTEGVRVLFQYTIFEPEISFYLNVGHYREYNDRGFHIYGGISAIDLWEKLSFGFSHGIRDILYPIQKTEADITWQLSDPVSFNFTAKDKRYRDSQFRFNEQDYSFQAAHSGGLSLFVTYQYSHNRIIGLNHFYSGGSVLTLKKGLEIRLSGGTIRGGQVCSGGQCYILPPFKGIKFSLLKTFR